jgi:hypothetical protein
MLVPLRSVDLYTGVLCGSPPIMLACYIRSRPYGRSVRYIIYGYVARAPNACWVDECGSIMC